MPEQEKREKVIEGLEQCAAIHQGFICESCVYPGVDCAVDDAIALLKAQEHADFIPIDWLMNYAQLPTEFAISEWRKPKKEAKIKQAKSLDKPMMLDDALELLKAQEAVKPKKNDVDFAGLKTWDWACPECNCILTYRAKYCSCCGKPVKWDD